LLNPASEVKYTGGILIKNKIGIGSIFATILLITIVFVPMVSAQENATIALTFGPGTLDVLKKNPNFIAAYGNIPAFSNQSEREQWLSNLDIIYSKANKMCDKEMSKYFIPNGPVTGYGYTIDGVLEVTIKKGRQIDTAKQNEIYNLFSNYGQEINLKDIPITFVHDDFVPTSRSSTWRPLIGGIQIVSDGNGGPAQSTLGFATKATDGTTGFLVAEHAIGGIGSGVYQPTASSANYIGSVSKYANNYADAALVPSSNVRAVIYDFDTDSTRNVVSYGDPSKGDTVYKSGISTGKTNGQVTAILTTKYNNGLGKYLYNQCVAAYRCDYGDSGSPVFEASGIDAKIVGIHWGGDGTYTPGYGYSSSIFSPVSGIHNDLSVYPLKT